MILKLVFKNIRNSILGYKSIYILLIVSQLLAGLMLYFSYGIIASFNYSKQELSDDNKELSAIFETEKVTVAQLRVCMEEILRVSEERIDYFWLGCKDGISAHNEYYDGKFYLSQKVFKAEEMEKGRLFTVEEMNNGTKVVLGEKIGEVGETYIIEGEEFKIVGIEKPYTDSVMIQIPYMSIPENVYCNVLYFIFEESPTYKDYEAFKNVLKGHFGEAVYIDEFEVLDLESIIAMDSVIVISIIIGVIAALDTALLYGYLMKKRKKQIAVFGIVGANSMQNVFINETEIMLVSIFTSVCGFVIFKFLIEDLFMDIYGVGIEIYTTQIYGVMSGLYFLSIIMITFVMTIFYARKKILDVRRGNNV